MNSFIRIICVGVGLSSIIVTIYSWAKTPFETPVTLGALIILGVVVYFFTTRRDP